MDLTCEWVDVTGDGLALQAYRVRPAVADGALPAVVLVQEIWGVDEHVQDLAWRFAAAGYLALAPDLYSLGGRRPPELAQERVAAVKRFLDTIPPSSWWDEEARGAALAALPAAERDALSATFATLFGPRDLPRWVRALRASVAHLRADSAFDGRVGSVGWCMGGALSARLACAEPQLAAAVVFYGASPEPGDLAGLACPVLGLYGGDDPRISDTVPALAEAMAAAGKDFEWHIYEGAPHAFFNDTRRSYHVGAARDAWARCLGFFARTLAPAAARSGHPGGA